MQSLTGMPRVPTPANGTDIVRLSMELRRLERERDKWYPGTRGRHEADEALAPVREAWIAAVDSRL